MELAWLIRGILVFAVEELPGNGTSDGCKSRGCAQIPDKIKIFTCWTLMLQVWDWCIPHIGHLAIVELMLLSSRNWSFVLQAISFLLHCRCIAEIFTPAWFADCRRYILQPKDWSCFLCSSCSFVSWFCELRGDVTCGFWSDIKGLYCQLLKMSSIKIECWMLFISIWNGPVILIFFILCFFF